MTVVIKFARNLMPELLHKVLFLYSIIIHVITLPCECIMMTIIKRNRAKTMKIVSWLILFFYSHFFCWWTCQKTLTVIINDRILTARNLQNVHET